MKATIAGGGVTISPNLNLSLTICPATPGAASCRGCGLGGAGTPGAGVPGTLLNQRRLGEWRSGMNTSHSVLVRGNLNEMLRT